MNRRLLIRRLSRRGDATTPVLIWTTSIGAVLLIALWYTSANRSQTQIEPLNEDLRALHEDLAFACTYGSFSHDLPLHLRTGVLTINTTTICIDTKASLVKCVPTPCDQQEHQLNLTGIVALRIRKSAAGTSIEGLS